MEVKNTKVPIALTWGSIFPCTISRITTGKVLFKPDTNQETANSSNETAAARQSPDMIAGLQNGIMTYRIVAHSDPPKFQDADSRSGSI
jgi:hypothetical protein